MKINIQSVGFKTSKNLEVYIDRKVQKLIKLNERLIGVDVNLKLEKNSVLNNKIAEMSLKVPGNDLFARKNANTFKEAVNFSIEALRKQQKKQLGKLRRKKIVCLNFFISLHNYLKEYIYDL